MAVLDFLCALFVRSLVSLIQILPRSLGMYLCRFVVRCLLFFMPRLRDVARRNLELVFPEKSSAEREEILEKSLEVLARNLMTYCKLPTLSADEARAMCDFSAVKKVYDQAKSERPNVGVIMGTLHYGSFEMIVQLHAVHVRRAWIVARGFGLKRTDEFWFSRREHFGCKVFRRKGAFPEMIRQLQAGEDIAVLFDQNVKSNHAVFVDFLGKQAASAKSLALASLRTGAPIICGVIHETEPLRYELRFHRVDTNLREGEDPDDAVLRITQELSTVSGEWVREHPEDWFWIHRRFKTRPPGEAEDLYDGIRP